MGDPIIRTEGLAKSFGDVHALKGIDLEVPQGTVFGLLGPNGAGKTTAVRILTTILRPDSGSAHVLGIDVAKNPAAVRTKIGLAGQFAAVDENLTGRENLWLFGRLYHLSSREARRRADDLLEQFDLSDAANRVVKTYSGGMRRRLDLGAALIARPRLLILDEPTTGLDPRSRIDLWGVIEGLVNDGTTLLLTTQYLEEADRLADNIMVIDGGMVIAEGTAAELKSSLGTTIVEAVFDSSATAQRAAAVLGPLGHGAPTIVTNSVSIKVDEPTAALFGVVRALDDGKIMPESVIVREPSLDDVFLTLTGHTTGVDDASSDKAGVR